MPRKIPPASLVGLLCWLLISAPTLAAEEEGGQIFEARGRSLEEMNTAGREIPLMTVDLPEDRLQRLQRTMTRLRNGESVRIVMLGDSIINDTARSLWHKRVEAMYPDSQIGCTVSVRGSTGCWWYKEDNRLERFVLEHKPDLVILGGISQRDDIDSIRECIHQIRAQSDCEFLLLTGPFGRADPLSGRDWRETLRAGKDAQYAEDLAALAKEQDAQFFDLQKAWGDYLRAADKPLEFYKRDEVHANAHGEAVLGVIMAAYFAPAQ